MGRRKDIATKTYTTMASSRLYGRKYRISLEADLGDQILTPVSEYPVIGLLGGYRLGHRERAYLLVFLYRRISGNNCGFDEYGDFGLSHQVVLATEGYS